MSEMSLLEQLEIAKEFWEEYEGLSAAVKKKEGEISQAKSTEEYLSKKTHETPGDSKILGGVVALFILGLAFVFSFCMLFSELSAGDVDGERVIQTIASALGAIISVVIISKGRKKNRLHRAEATKQYEEYKAELPGRLQVLNKELEVLQRQRDQYWKDRSHCLLFLPEKYRLDFCVEIMLELVENRRADTLKEAVNLCEQELRQRRAEHAQRVREKEAELYQMALLKQLERQNDELERIRHNSDYERWYNNNN